MPETKLNMNDIMVSTLILEGLAYKLLLFKVLDQWTISVAELFYPGTSQFH